MEQINTFNNKSVRKIAETVRHVEGLPRQQGRGNQGRQKTYKARLTATINDPAPPNDPIPYQFEAEQVYWDGSAWQAVTDGLEWDSDKVLYVYDSGEVGDIVNAELTSDGSTGSYWLALKPAGGGGEKVRLKVKATATSLSGVIFLCDIIDNAGTVLTASVNVRQKKFASAKFYINEIIYADAEGADYLADAYLAGIGVG